VRSAATWTHHPCLRRTFPTSVLCLAPRSRTRCVGAFAPLRSRVGGAGPLSHPSGKRSCIHQVSGEGAARWSALPAPPRPSQVSCLGLLALPAPNAQGLDEDAKQWFTLTHLNKWRPAAPRDVGVALKLFRLYDLLVRRVCCAVHAGTRAGLLVRASPGMYVQWCA